MSERCRPAFESHPKGFQVTEHGEHTVPEIPTFFKSQFRQPSGAVHTFVTSVGDGACRSIGEIAYPGP